MNKLKQLYQKLISKIGVDRFAHIGIGGFLSGVCSMFGWLPSLFGFVIISILCLVKEECLDEKFDWIDLVCGIGGALVPFIIAIILAVI